MKPCTLVVVQVAILILASGTACQQETVAEEEMGLDKHGVQATPDPIVATSSAGEPGENQTIDPYFEGSPPVIPHLIDELVPIRIGENQCLECHDQPDMIGQEVEAGEATPIPATHYTDLRRDPGTVTGRLIGARYVCTQCHAPQADAAPLVENTYGP